MTYWGKTNVSQGFVSYHINFDAPYVFLTVGRQAAMYYMCEHKARLWKGDFSSYRDALHRLVWVDLMFHVTKLDSFDQNFFKVHPEV